jgi:archaeal flagellin FlaB
MRYSEVNKMRNMFKNEHAFTGLEAAIVLIAFVVVAAVFSYVVLGAGFFTTQKSQEVVHTGVQQASSSMEIVGNVFGINDTADADCLTYVKFTVATTAGGTGLDISKMVVSYSDETNRIPDLTYVSTVSTDAPAANSWKVMEMYNNDTDTLLETGEQFVIGVAVPGSTTVNTPFQINLQPSVGAVFQIKRNVGPSIEKVNILY